MWGDRMGFHPSIWRSGKVRRSSQRAVIAVPSKPGARAVRGVSTRPILRSIRSPTSSNRQRPARSVGGSHAVVHGCARARRSPSVSWRGHSCNDLGCGRVWRRVVSMRASRLAKSPHPGAVQATRGRSRGTSREGGPCPGPPTASPVGRPRPARRGASTAG